jgi:hypothetical protein
MSTRCTIIIDDGYDGEKLYLDRTHDAFPENVIADITEVVNDKRGSWSRPEAGCLVAAIIVKGWPDKQRLPDYEPKIGPSGDDCYQYHLSYDRSEKEWHIWYTDSGEKHNAGYIKEQS